MDLLSEVEEVMVGAAPVDQSPQERPKGPSTDSTSTLPYSYDVSNPSSPSSSPVVSTLNSSSGVPSIIIPPDIPIKVEYLPDPIPVPSPLFHFPGYSTSTSIPISSSISTFYTPQLLAVLLWLTLLAKRFPILYLSSGLHPLLGLSLYLPNLWLIPIILVPFLLTCFHLCPALSLIIRTYPHVLLSLQRSFPHLLPLHPSLLVFSLQGNLGEDSLSSRGHSSRGKSPRGQGRGCTTPSRHSSHSSFGSHNFPFSHSSPMFSQRCLSRDGALALSTKPRVCSYFSQNPTVNPFFINYSCSPKIFSPIISFNEPYEYVFNMFSFIYTYDFFPGQDNRSLLISAIKQ